MADLASITGLKGRISATRRKLGVLATVRAWWPLMLFVAVFVGAALAGAFEQMDKPMAALATLVFFVGSIILFFRGLSRYQSVSRAEAEDALDRQSDLRPLQSLTDRPADPSRDAQSLWKRHTERLAAEARTLRPPKLKAEWKAIDPFFLRAIVPIALVCLLVLANTAAPSRLMNALSPDYGSLMGAEDMVVEAWITPPDYSGRPPIFLKPGLEGVRVPKGSIVTLRTAARSAPRLVLKGKTDTRRQRFEQTPDGAYEANAELVEDTRLSVKWWGERAAWAVAASPDDAPTATFVSLPFFSTQDRTEFTWEVSDDYGITRLDLAIRLKQPNPAAPDEELRVPVPLPGLSVTSASESTQIDLTRNKWAGLAVDMELVATDAAGQEGRSETIPYILPEKLFLEPLARAAQEVRVTVLREPRGYEDVPKNTEALVQDGVNAPPQARLEYAPEEVQRASVMLDAITYDGHKYIEDRSLYFAFRMAHGILESAVTKDDADEIDTLLWAAALKAEYGSAADALRRLMAARRALENALREGASEDEIRRRMETFRDAANDYVAAKMAEAIANGGEAPMSGEDMAGMGGENSLGGQDFEDMLNALQDLTDTGATDQARQLLTDITNMLENLEFQQGQNGQGGFGMPGQEGESDEGNEELPEDEQQMTEAMERLADILREQRELNDDTLAQERGETPGEQAGQQGEQGQGQEQGGEQGEGQQAGQQGQSGAQPGEGGEQPGEGQAGIQPGQGQEGQSQGGQQAGSESGPGGQEQGGTQGTQLGENGQGSGNEQGGEGPGGRGETLAERQERLGRMVDEFARENGLGSGSAGEEGGQENALAGRLDEDALEDIRRAQQRAAGSLDVGNERRAQRNQEQATRLLSDLTRNLGQELDELQEARRGEMGEGGAGRDPFGRPVGGGGNGENVAIPDEAERQRAKDILDELRRRYGEAEDDEEREYLERLLDRF